MTTLRQTLFVVLLGTFWGISPVFYRLMAEAGMPIIVLILIVGIAVGLSLAAIQWARRRPVMPPGQARQAIVYGLGCGLLLNLPFASGIVIISKIAVPVYAVILSTAPLMNYLFSLAIGRERPTHLRIFALLIGFVSSVVLIVSRDGMLTGDLNIWVLAAFAVPVLYALYNHYTSWAWPVGLGTLAAGAVESFGTAIVVLPLFAILPVGDLTELPAWSYWLIAGMSAMWVVERIVYFSLIKHAGPVTTVQAVYVSTPAGVVFSMIALGSAVDIWIVISVMLLLVALWLNNQAMARALSAQRQTAAAV